MKIDNISLFEQKEQLRFPEDRSYRYTYYYLIHGLWLEFRTEEKLPSSNICWEQDISQKADIIVYWYDPAYFNFDETEWSDERASDCYWKNKRVIQRDFVAEKIEDVYAVCFSFVRLDGWYNFLRWLLPPFLIRQNILLLHSSAVVLPNNHALLFLGYSGRGKSTIASMATPLEVIGDDINRIDIAAEGNLYVSAAKLGGMIEIGNDLRYIVDGVYWLEQAEINRLEHVSPMQMWQYLYASLIGWNWRGLEEDVLAQLDALANEFLKRKRIDRLFFKKDRSVWRFLLSR